MKKLSFLLLVVLMTTAMAQLTARNSKAPLPKPTHDILQLIASNSDSGRPYSDGGDLRVIVPTLQDRRLELPCLLASYQPLTMELLLLGGDKTWAFVSFSDMDFGSPNRSMYCYHDDYNEFMKNWPPPGSDGIIY